MYFTFFFLSTLTVYLQATKACSELSGQTRNRNLFRPQNLVPRLQILQIRIQNMFIEITRPTVTAHPIDTWSDWDLGNTAAESTPWTFCYVPETLPERVKLCGRAHYSVERGKQQQERLLPGRNSHVEDRAVCQRTQDFPSKTLPRALLPSSKSASCCCSKQCTRTRPRKQESFGQASLFHLLHGPVRGWTGVSMGTPASLWLCSKLWCTVFWELCIIASFKVLSYLNDGSSSVGIWPHVPDAKWALDAHNPVAGSPVILPQRTFDWY